MSDLAPPKFLLEGFIALVEATDLAPFEFLLERFVGLLEATDLAQSSCLSNLSRCLKPQTWHQLNSCLSDLSRCLKPQTWHHPWSCMRDLSLCLKPQTHWLLQSSHHGDDLTYNNKSQTTQQYNITFLNLLTLVFPYSLDNSNMIYTSDRITSNQEKSCIPLFQNKILD